MEKFESFLDIADKKFVGKAESGIRIIGDNLWHLASKVGLTANTEPDKDKKEIEEEVKTSIEANLESVDIQEVIRDMSEFTED